MRCLSEEIPFLFKGHGGLLWSRGRLERLALGVVLQERSFGFAQHSTGELEHLKQVLVALHDAQRRQRLEHQRVAVGQRENGVLLGDGGAVGGQVNEVRIVLVPRRVQTSGFVFKRLHTAETHLGYDGPDVVVPRASSVDDGVAVGGVFAVMLRSVLLSADRGGRRGLLQVAVVDAGLAAVLVQIEEDGVSVADVQRLLLVHGLQSLLLGVAVLSARVQQCVLKRALLVLGQLDLTCAGHKSESLAMAC